MASLSTVRGHGRPCILCGTKTYTTLGVCRDCKGEGVSLPKPKRLPEPYLMLCAEELARRHKERREALKRIGMLTGEAA